MTTFEISSMTESEVDTFWGDNTCTNSTDYLVQQCRREVDNCLTRLDERLSLQVTSERQQFKKEVHRLRETVSALRRELENQRGLNRGQRMVEQGLRDQVMSLRRIREACASCSKRICPPARLSSGASKNRKRAKVNSSIGSSAAVLASAKKRARTEAAKRAVKVPIDNDDTLRDARYLDLTLSPTSACDEVRSAINHFDLLRAPEDVSLPPSDESTDRFTDKSIFRENHRGPPSDAATALKPLETNFLALEETFVDNKIPVKPLREKNHEQVHHITLGGSPTEREFKRPPPPPKRQLNDVVVRNWLKRNTRISSTSSTSAEGTRKQTKEFVPMACSTLRELAKGTNKDCATFMGDDLALNTKSWCPDCYALYKNLSPNKMATRMTHCTHQKVLQRSSGGGGGGHTTLSDHWDENCDVKQSVVHQE